MEREDLGAWLRLTLTPGVGTLAGRRLLTAFGLPQTIFSQDRAALQQVVTPAQASALLTVPPDWAAQFNKTWDWLQAATPSGVRRAVTVPGDALYPPGLLQLEDPPLLLYLAGRIGSSSLESSGHQAEPRWPPGPCIAIVGSRNPTPQGQANARRFAGACAEAGLTVVSGLALGIDGAAHEGALDAQQPATQWATIAVVGTGLDQVYPGRHMELAQRIAQHGLLVSEYALGTPPLAANFPRRNRILSGLCLGTLVVEAALKSGSLITARLAVEQGREVFAIPGSIHSPQSRGCHELIKQGAKLVETAQDILEELKLPITVDANGPDSRTLSAPDHHSPQSQLLQALGQDPVNLDALMARTGLSASALQVQLLQLELEGQVSRLPGGLFQRLSSA